MSTTSSPTPTSPSPEGGSAPTTFAQALAALRGAVAGEVVTPADAGYATTVAGWNLAARHTPLVVVAAADAADVALAVTLARDFDLGLGVQGTGHGSVRPIDGVMVLTRGLQELTVDAAARTARVGAGCTWGTVLDACQAHGLAPLAGSSATVGAVGYTLGGGIGWLSRRYGPACDAVRAFDVVTADGRQVRASATEEPELFRALRGGGGGVLGVVTAMEIDLFPVTTVYAGNLLYPVEAAAEVVDRYATWVADAPDELTSSVAFMNFPPLPEVPDPLRGRSFVIVRGCWCGDLAEGRALVDGWRAAMPPMIDLWDDMPFAAMAMISGDPVDPLPCSDTGAWLTGLDGVAGGIIAAGTFPQGGPPPVMLSEVRHLGGAVARTSDSSALSSMGNRDATFLFHTVGLPTAPGSGVAVSAGQAALLEALGSYVSDRAYLNFLDGEARRAGTRAAVDADACDAIAALRTRLDPEDRMRFGVDHRA